MSLVVKGAEPKAIEIQDGLHFGVIKKVEERSVEKYNYLDLYVDVETEDEPIELRVGYNITNLPKFGLNKNQDIGKLIIRILGKPIEPDKEYDLEQILVGKRVQFVTLTGETYANITKESVKPVVDASASKEVPVQETE